MKKTRTSQQEEAISAFKELATQLSGQIKEGKPEVKERLAQAQHVDGIERYSPLNQLLILTQCPTVSEVHGYNEWKALGFQVRKGEHGIRIIAPHQYEKDGEDKVGFHSTVVFDASQVDQIELPAEEQMSA